MPTYIFSGRVLPERANVNIQLPLIFVQNNEARLEFHAQVAIGASQVSVVVDTEEEADNLLTLRNYVEWLVRMAVDAFGYLKGIGYDVEITSVVNPSGTLWQVFGVGEPSLAQSESERPVGFPELWKVLTSGAKTAPLQQALGDLREAIRAPHDTGFFCYRAIESLRQHYVEASDGDNTGLSWDRLRAALRIDRLWINPLVESSKQHRHGGSPYSSGEERASAMQHAWKVVDRFVAYAQRDYQPLPEAEYPLLQ